MARSSDEPAEDHKLFCPSCKEEFLSYRRPGPEYCPRCGRQIHTRSKRRKVSAAALVLLAALLIAAVLAYHFGILPRFW